MRLINWFCGKRFGTVLDEKDWEVMRISVDNVDEPGPMPKNFPKKPSFKNHMKKFKEAGKSDKELFDEELHRENKN